MTPKKTVSSTATGEDSTFAPVSSRQSTVPRSRLSPVTDPSWELTTSTSPAIAGVDAFVPDSHVQSTFPVSASIASVFPPKEFT